MRANWCCNNLMVEGDATWTNRFRNMLVVAQRRNVKNAPMIWWNQHAKFWKLCHQRSSPIQRKCMYTSRWAAACHPTPNGSSERTNLKVLMFHGTLFFWFVNHFGCCQLNLGRRFGDGGGGGSGQIRTPTIGTHEDWEKGSGLWSWNCRERERERERERDACMCLAFDSFALCIISAPTSVLNDYACNSTTQGTESILIFQKANPISLTRLDCHL